MNNNFKDARNSSQRERNIKKIIDDCEKGRPEPRFDTAHEFNCYAADLPEALKRLERGHNAMKRELARAKKADKRRGELETIIESAEDNIKRLSEEPADNERKLREARR